MEPLISGVTASLLTLFDLDRTFYVPERVRRKLALKAWSMGFVIANGIAAAALYSILKDIEALRKLDPVLSAIIIGISYLAIIRAKFTTFNYHGREVPFGLEAFYEGAKSFVYKRINQIAKAARFEETTELANRLAMKDLVARAKLYIEQDQLLTVDEKRKLKAWVLKVIQDTNTSEEDKRAVVADYILSGQQSSDYS